MSIFAEVVSPVVPFTYGLEYVVKHGFSLSHDPSAFFIKGEKLVFIQKTITWIDKAEYGYTNLYFYNSVRGAAGILKYANENDLNVFSKYHFALTGGWPHPDQSAINRISTNDFDPDDKQNVIRSFIPYFKSILEGDSHVENWFYWLARHDKILQEILTPMEWLRLKTDSYGELKKILDQNNIPYEISLRYAWLSVKLNAIADI
jgi:hypothetical protein